MSYFRTLCALTLGAAIAACAGEAVAPEPELGTIALSKGVQVIDDHGHNRGHCFRQVGIDAPRVEPSRRGSTTFSAAAGKVITRVAIKAGSLCLFTPEGTTGTFTFQGDRAPCFVIEGLGTATVTVRRVGRGHHCNEITRLQFLTGPAPVVGGDTGGGVGSGGDSTVTGGGGTSAPSAMAVCVSTARPLSDTFGVTIGSPSGMLVELAVPAGTCSAATPLPADIYPVQLAVPAGYTVLSIVVDPAGRLVSADPFMGTVNVVVENGSTTTVTFLSDAP